MTDFKQEQWWKVLFKRCKTYGVKGIQIFIEFNDWLGREPTREEFNELWDGHDRYYYYLVKKWRKMK